MTLLDQYGREIEKNRPITDEIVVSSIRDRYNSYPGDGLTPERLATILREADQGDVYRQAELFEQMEEKDLHLGGILQTRKLAIVGLDYEILPASNSAEDKKIAAAAQEMLEYVDGWEDSLLDTMDAIGKGFAVQEIIWDISEGQVWAKKLNWIHQKRFTFTGPPTTINGMTINPLLQVPRLITDEAQVYGEELIPNKFIYHRYKARSGAASRGGLCRPCAYMYLFKNFDIKAWLTFAELYSVPMRIGKYPAGASKQDISTLKKAVFNLAVDAAAVMSDSTIIEILESKGRGETSAFKDLAEYCERGMSKAILGHTGSSDSTPGKLGSDDQAKLIRQDLLEFDGKSTERLIKTQLLAPWAAFNYGPDKGVPKFKLHYKADEDLEKAARTYGVLVKDVNYKGIGVKHIKERFGLPDAEPGEETVSAAETASPFDVGTLPAEKKATRQTAMTNKCTCGCDREIMVNSAGDPSDAWITKYMNALAPSMKSTRADALAEMETWLRGLDARPSVEDFVLKIQSLIGTAFADIDKKAIIDATAEIYGFYRLTDILTGTQATFGGPDIRAMQFLSQLDHFYASKFVQNPDSVATIKNFLNQQYLENGEGLFKSQSDASVQAFRDLFDQKLGDLQDYQIRRIADTAVQRNRNWAHISQLHAGGITRLVVVEPTRDCAFCAAMDGKIISVANAYNRMQAHMDMSPEEYQAQFSEPDNQPTIENTAKLVAAGAMPPYHPHCRGRVIKQ